MKKRHHASGYLFLSARRTRLAGRLQLFEKKSFPTKILLIFNYKIVVWEKLRPSLQFSISATSALVNELAISANYQIITRSITSNRHQDVLPRAILRMLPFRRLKAPIIWYQVGTRRPLINSTQSLPVSKSASKMLILKSCRASDIKTGKPSYLYLLTKPTTLKKK